MPYIYNEFEWNAFKPLILLKMKNFILLALVAAVSSSSVNVENNLENYYPDVPMSDFDFLAEEAADKKKKKKNKI